MISKKIPVILVIAAFALCLTMVAGNAEKKEKATPEEQADLHFQIGESLFGRGDYLSALRELMLSVQLNKNNAEAQFLLGTTYLYLKHYTEAELAIKIALDLKKDDPQGYPQANTSLGNVYLATGKYDLAIAQFKKTLDSIFYQPKFPQSHTNIGIAYMKKGDTKNAEEYFKNAIKLDPNYCPAYLNIGSMYSQAKRHDEAIEAFQKVLEICGTIDEYKIARLYLGLEFNDTGKRAEACEQFIAIIKDAPKSPVAKKAGEYIRLLQCK